MTDWINAKEMAERLATLPPDTELIAECDEDGCAYCIEHNFHLFDSPTAVDSFFVLELGDAETGGITAGAAAKALLERPFASVLVEDGCTGFKYLSRMSYDERRSEVTITA